MGILSYDSKMSLELIEHMRRTNIPERYILPLIKGGYMFSKAHAVNCVMNEMGMAWYKIHYPLEFKNMSTETFQYRK